MSDLMPWFAPWSGRILALGLFLSGLTLVYASLLWDRSRGRPRCPTCWYDRTATEMQPCPECGHTIHQKEQLFHTRRHWRLALVGLLIAISLPTFVVQRRVRQFGWSYYATYGPLYWISPHRFSHEVAVGPFAIRYYENRREWWEDSFLRISPGDLVLKHSSPSSLYRWTVASTPAASMANGKDMTGNGRPNLLLYRHIGGDRWECHLYELTGDTLVIADPTPDVVSIAHAETGTHIEWVTPDGTVQTAHVPRR